MRATEDVELPAIVGPLCFTCQERPAGTPDTWYRLSAYCCVCQPDPDPAETGIKIKWAAARQAELNAARMAVAPF